MTDPQVPDDAQPADPDAPWLGVHTLTADELARAVEGWHHLLLQLGEK